MPRRAVAMPAGYLESVQRLSGLECRGWGDEARLETTQQRNLQLLHGLEIRRIYKFLADLMDFRIQKYILKIKFALRT